MEKRHFPAKVIKVFEDKEKLTINRGSEDGVQVDQKFLIYQLGEELFDPDTRESLGNLEVVRGIGKVIHVQPRMATLESDQRTREKVVKKYKGTFAHLYGAESEETSSPVIQPFDGAVIGDFAKRVK